MKKARPTIALALFLGATVGTLSLGQDKTITVPTLSAKAFVTTPAIKLLRHGDAGNLVMGDGRDTYWDERVHDFVIGGQTVKYSVFGIIPGSGSDSAGNFTVFASTTVIREDVRAGEVLRSGGYLVEAKRAMKAGESIPTLLLTTDQKAYSILSIEAAPATKGKDKRDAAKSQPWLAIFGEHATPRDRALALEAWRISNEIAANLRAIGFITKGVQRPSPL
jgi:hypothetical protein